LKENISSYSLFSAFKSQDVIMGLLWTIPVVMKLISMPDSLMTSTSIFIALLCFINLWINPYSALISLPFLTLLSPMVGFINLPIGKTLLSDIFFLILILQLVVLLIRKRDLLNQFTFNKSLLIISSLFIISLLFGFIMGIITGLKPLLYFIQLFIIYYYTTNYSKSEITKQKIMNAWVFACVLGSLILIQAFVTGQQLQNMTLDENRVVEDKSKLEYLFRATYYYTGFIYLVGISILVLFVKLFYKDSILKKLVVFAPSIILLLIALVLMNNKTIIFSMLFIIALLLYKLISLGYLNKRKFVIFLTTFTILLIFVVFPLYFQFADENQYELMVVRFTSSSSFVARTEVYISAFKQWVNYPVQIILGMGPDFLDGSGVPSYSTDFKKSLVTGIVEGTVDSGWLSYLVELGILSFVFIVLIYMKSILYSYRYFLISNAYKLMSPSPLIVFICLLFIALALTTQMLGYTKTLWLPFQLFVFGIMYLNESGSQSTRV
jgi:hypothetical protein